jgi:hypothetical protein
MKTNHLTLVSIMSAFLAVAPMSRLAMAAPLMPLKQYWSEARKEHIALATAETEKSARAAGYVGYRVEGCVFTIPASGMVPLKLYWSEARKEHITLATKESEAAALEAGYVGYRVEGYVLPPSSCSR